MLSNIKLEPRDTRPYYHGGLAGAQDPCWVIGASPATLIHEHTAKQNKNRFPLKFLFVVSHQQAIECRTRSLFRAIHSSHSVTAPTFVKQAWTYR